MNPVDVSRILEKHGNQQEGLISILEEIQAFLLPVFLSYLHLQLFKLPAYSLSYP